MKGRTKYPKPITGDRCPMALCRGRLEFATDLLIGRVTVRCRQCERRLAGICRDCPRPIDGVVGKSYRCAECKARARRALEARSQARHIERRRIAQRERARRPEVRARQRANRQAWDAAHRERVREQKRAQRQKQRQMQVAA